MYRVFADELTNTGLAAIAAFILGVVVHSAYIHSKRYEHENYPWDHDEDEECKQDSK